MLTQAIEYYGDHGIDFSNSILTPYLVHGYVVSRPDMLILFRSADSADVDNWHSTSRNTWFVEWASGAGKIKKMISYMPYELPFTAWYRGFKKGADEEPPHIYKTEKILRRS